MTTSESAILRDDFASVLEAPSKPFSFRGFLNGIFSAFRDSRDPEEGAKMDERGTLDQDDENTLVPKPKPLPPVTAETPVTAPISSPAQEEAATQKRNMAEARQLVVRRLMEEVRLLREKVELLEKANKSFQPARDSAPAPSATATEPTAAAESTPAAPSVPEQTPPSQKPSSAPRRSSYVTIETLPMPRNSELALPHIIATMTMVAFSLDRQAARPPIEEMIAPLNPGQSARRVTEYLFEPLPTESV